MNGGGGGGPISLQRRHSVTMYKILLLDQLSSGMLALVKRELPTGFELFLADKSTPDAVLRQAAETDFILTISEPVTPEMINAGKRLKLIHQWGVGYEKINLDAARAKSIPVARTTGANAVAVAEHTILLILAVYRQLVKADNMVRSGTWPRWDLRLKSYELMGKMVGIVGFGAVGREVAKRLKAFETKTYYYDVYPATPEQEKTLGVLGSLPLDELINTSDVVVINCPLNEQTRGLMNTDRFKAMKKTAILVNCARGPIVDEKALYWALTQGEILGAGLDVFEREPINADNPLLTLTNVILSPHTASATRDTIGKLAQRAFENMRRVSEGLKVEQIYVVD